MDCSFKYSHFSFYIGILFNFIYFCDMCISIYLHKYLSIIYMEKKKKEFKLKNDAVIALINEDDGINPSGESFIH